MITSPYPTTEGTERYVVTIEVTYPKGMVTDASRQLDLNVEKAIG